MDFWRKFGGLKGLEKGKVDQALKIINSLYREVESDGDSPFYNSRKNLLNSYQKLYLGAGRVLHPVADFPKESVPSSSVSISFVSSVFNRFWQLQRTLEENLKVVRMFDNCNLTVVDFGGDDSERIKDYICTQFSFDLMSGNLIYQRISSPWSTFHMSSAKNSASRLSKNDYIYSLDADNFITESDVSNVIRYFQDNPLGIYHQTTGAAPMLHEMWRDYLSASIDLPFHKEKLTWDGSCGRIAVHRKLYEEINGYNENLIGMGMDDIDFLLRLIKISGAYHHERIERPIKNIFIENGSSSKEYAHTDNDSNWRIMDRCLNDDQVRAAYSARNRLTDFEAIPSDISHKTNDFSVTLFSSVFNAEKYIDRFLGDLEEISTSDTNYCILILDIVGSHPDWVSDKLKAIALSENVFYVAVNKDPGLYETWNIALKNISSEYIANLNVDDVRGSGWLDACMLDLERNVCDVSSPVTIPFDDKSFISISELKSLKSGRWFDKRSIYNCYSRKTSYRDINSGFYNHIDLFQVLEGGELSSYCIPNASSVWRKSIHDNVGYFNEAKHGAFADLELWMRASIFGFRFKQNRSVAFFALSDEQAHKRQNSCKSILIDLAFKYGSSDIRLKASESIYNLSLIRGSYGQHHFMGWDWVRDQLNERLVHNEEGVLLDLFVERTFFWNVEDRNKKFVYDKPWFGFVHTTAHNNKAFSDEASNLMELVSNSRFLSSLEFCVGLAVLTLENKLSLETLLREQGWFVEIYVLFHPNIPVAQSEYAVESQFNYTDAIFHIGWHLRSFSKFADLDIPKSHKVLLIPGGMDENYFLENIVNRELSLAGMGDIRDYIGHYFHANDIEYQHILNNEVIFNFYIQPAGSNLISESISARSRLILNRHPAFEELLGRDYPLFYDDPYQAKLLINRLQSDNDLVDEVKKYLGNIQSEYSFDRFMELFSSLSIRVFNQNVAME